MIVSDPALPSRRLKPYTFVDETNAYVPSNCVLVVEDDEVSALAVANNTENSADRQPSVALCHNRPPKLQVLGIRPIVHFNAWSGVSSVLFVEKST
jgi:hypothetical protein